MHGNKNDRPPKKKGPIQVIHSLIFLSSGVCKRFESMGAKIISGSGAALRFVGNLAATNGW
jgi:hypothetical protein